MKKIFLILLFLLLNLPLHGHAKIRVATTTTDLAAIVKEIGKDKVDVFSIAKGTQDPHQIEAKPSFMVKLRSADLMIAQGLELETAWMNPLIQGSRNTTLLSKDRIMEVAQDLNPIEIPHGNISRSEGDVHPGGNPHFQLDPIRLGKAAVLIAARLGEIDPSIKDFTMKNALDFQKRMETKNKEWQERIKKSGVTQVVTYHKTFSYFCDRYGIKCDIQLEPKPGIPPTASHILYVIDQMKKRKINLVLIENLYEDSVGSKLKQEVPTAKIFRVPVSVGGEPSLNTNEELIENLVKTIEKGSH